MNNSVMRFAGRLAGSAALVIAAGAVLGATPQPAGDSPMSWHNAAMSAPYDLVVAMPGDDTHNDGGGSVRNSGAGSTAVNTSAGGGSATLTATQPRTETSTRTSTITAPRTDDHTVTNSYNRTTEHDSHDTHIPGP